MPITGICGWSRYDPGMSIFGPGKKTQVVLQKPSAYFDGGPDSIFWHFCANGKIKWPATVHWVLHSQVVLKTVV